MQSSVRCRLRNHLLETIRGGLAKTVGNEDLSRSLRAKARLRLIRMPDEELWELVKLTASSPQRPVEPVYKEISQSEVYTAMPVPNPSFFWRGLLKTLAPVVETRGQNDDVDNSVGFLLSGLVR